MITKDRINKAIVNLEGLRQLEAEEDETSEIVLNLADAIEVLHDCKVQLFPPGEG